MFVSIAHSQADLSVAEALKAFLEAQAFQVELLGEDAWSRPRRPDGAIVALWSKESPFAPHRLAFEKLALDAWSDSRLVFVKLDAHFAPVGLRDLSFIDATFETQREVVAWRGVAKRLRELQHPPRILSQETAPSALQAPAPAPPGGEPSAKRAQRQPGPTTPRKPGSPLAILVGVILLIAVVVLGLKLPSRGNSGNTDALTGMAIVAGGLIGAVILAGVLRRRNATPSEGPAPASGTPSAIPSLEGAASTRSIFISYARADSPVVKPICDDLEKRGQELWIDTAELSAGESWAGEIVRAIKTVSGVAVMCSKAAFESDHVKRELYLADRYKRRIVPVFLEDAPIPEDFEYFFAGVQWLKLKDTPPADRGKAVAKAIATIS
jgi:hypothetical protein